MWTPLEVVFPFCAVLTGVCGLVAVARIRAYKYRGFSLAIAGFLLPFLLSFLPIRWFPSLGEFYFRMECGQSMKGIGKCIAACQRDFGGRFPDPNKWCDLLVENHLLTEYTLR